MKRVSGLVLTVLLLTHFPPFAQAHSTLVSSNPKSGATLNSLPSRVSITFNEKLLLISGNNPHFLRVTLPSRNLLISESPTIIGNKISVAVKFKALTGSFKVSYRVVSADGHPITGYFFFTVK